MSSLKLWSPVAVAPVTAFPIRVRSWLLFALVAVSACTDPIVSSHDRHGVAHVLAPSDYGSLVGTTVSGGKLISPAGVVLGPVREIPTSPDSALTVPLVSQVPDEPTTAAFDQPPLCWYIVWYDRWGRVIHEELLWCDDWGLGPGSDTVSVEISCGEGDGEAGTESAERGDPVGCSIELDQGELEWVEWTFTGDSIGERTKKLTGEQGFVWPGKAVESVEVEATLRIVLGPELTTEVEAPSVDLTVTERGWTWSEAPNSYDWNNDTSPCRPWGAQWGMTQPTPCGRWFNTQGYQLSHGDEAWESLHFVSEANAPMNVVALLRPPLHSGGPRHSLEDADTLLVNGCKRAFGEHVQDVTVYQANTQCVDTVPGYMNAITHVQIHEERHLAIARRSVQRHNIYATWDSLYTTSQTTARTFARSKANQVDSIIEEAQDAIHQGTSMAFYRFWLFVDGRFQWATLRLPK